MIATTIAAIAGAASWSVSEYLIHNGLGHKYARNRNFFAVEHVRHHATTSYFAPNIKKAAAAAIATAAVGPVAAWLVGPQRGAAYTLGFVATYLGYEVLHRRAHTHPPKGRYGRWLRKHHFHHHFHKPSMNHGVTSAVWDHVFGTYEEPGTTGTPRTPGVIRVPEKHAMPWLVDPDTGDVWPEYQGDYQLLRKGRRGARSQPPSADTGASSPSYSA